MTERHKVPPPPAETPTDIPFLAQPTVPPPREAVLSIRMTQDDRDRIDRAAAASGMAPSTYARARLLGDGRDVPGWRTVYALIQDHVAAAERAGDPDSVERARRLYSGFSEVVRLVFPESHPSGPTS